MKEDRAKSSTAGSRRRLVLYLSAWSVQAVHEGIVDYAKQAGWILDNAMCYSGAIPHGVRPDGVICRHAFDSGIMEFTRKLKVPTVGFEHDDRLPIPRVYFDEEAIGAMAARHLLDRGFRTLGFVHLHFTPYQMPRMSGFKREAEAAGARFVELAPAVTPETWHPAPGPAWDWLREALSSIDTPVGVMATNDQIARPLIDALVDMGYGVPTEIAVVSAENDPMICEIAAVPISSVDTNTRRIGYEAAAMLDHLMDGDTPEKETRRIPPRRVETRASSDGLAIANVHAAEALHIIWQRYTEPIHVGEVAAFAPISRRRLQTLFLDHVGRTMQEEIARIRTAKACRLLKQTGLMVNEVAIECGFSTSLNLHRTFQTILGAGPKAFRESGTLPDLGVLPASAEIPAPG
jgi:LacI family transcriptional regulator